MPNPILLKFNATTGVVPTAGALTVRELALNTADGRLFTKTDAGSVVEFARKDQVLVNPALTGAATVDSYLAKTNGTAPASWLSQDGTGRQHWYWNTWGGTVPTFAVAGEDASDVMQHVSNAGAGGSFAHRSASGVGKAAGDAITWTTTIYSDLNSFTWKGNTVWHTGNDGAGSGLDADLLDGQQGSFYQNASNITSGSLPANVVPSNLYSSGSTVGSYVGSGMYYGAAAWRHLGTNSYGHVLRNSGATGAELYVASTAGTLDSAATYVTYTFSGAGDLTIPRYLNCVYVNISHAASGATTDTVFYSSTDNYIRKNTATGFKTSLGLQNVTNQSKATMFDSPPFTGKATIAANGVFLPASTAIAAASGATGGVEVQSQGTSATAGAAFMTFHRPGAYAAHIGLDTDNFWKVGGWSMGAVSYKIWHEGIDGTGSGLDADLLDGYHVGTSGATVPLLSTANTWGNNQTFAGNSSGAMVTISNSGAGVGLALDDFTVTSTAKVTNLNADLIDGIDSTSLIYGSPNNGTNNAPATWSGSHISQYKSGFFDVNGAAWTPNTGWWWGINTAHTSNSAAYLYGGQIIFENAATPRVFVRVTNGGATPGATAWQQVLTSTQGTYAGTLTSGQITAALGYTPGSASGAAVSVVSTNTTAVAGTTYVLIASLTLTLPASPAAGNMVTVSNRSSTATCVIARNAQNIMGLAEDMTLDDSGPVTLVFADATRGWVLV